MTPAWPAPIRDRWWTWLACGLLVVAPCSPARAESPSLLTPLQLVGYPSRTAAPSFGGDTIDARKISLTDVRGKVVLVNFWAT